MKGSTLKTLLLSAALLLAAGCSSTDEDLKTCPNGGIGVGDADGVSASDQIGRFTEYNCDKPQICPDIGGRSGFYRIDPNAAPGELSFVLTNCSTGNNKLEITKVEIWGDSSCDFKHTDSDIQPTKSVSPRETTTVRVTWKPKSAGENHAELRITTNAENFPVLRLRICGIAIKDTAPPPNPDAGAGPLDAGGNTADVLTGLQCKAANTQAACHK